MTQKPQHTPTLCYFVGNANGKGLIRIEIDGTGEHVASMPRGEKSKEYAAAIVRACNSHEMLLDALNGCLLYFTEQKEGTRAGTHPSELFELVATALEKAEQ